jgi:hypothetical protein
VRLSRKSVLSGGVKTVLVMGLRFVPCDRDRSFLMARDLRGWLPENHVAWFVLAAVEEVDLWSSMRLIVSTAGVARPTSRR